MRRIFTIFICSSCFGFNETEVFSQSPNWQWATSAGGIYGEVGNSIATDSVGNIFITGFSCSPSITFGSTTLTSSGNCDIYLAKYDALGNLIWAENFGGTANDQAYSISTDKFGNAYVTGIFQSPTITFGTYTLTSQDTGYGDFFAFKCNSSGNILWAKSAGGLYADNGNGISANDRGEVIVTGAFWSPSIIFGTTTLVNTSQGTDIFVAKYDSSGNVLWAKSYGGSQNDNVSKVTYDRSNNALITGTFASIQITFGTFTLTRSTGSDFFLVKFDSSGTTLWADNAGGLSDVYSSDVAADSSNNVLITGEFYSSTMTLGTTTLSNSGQCDIFLAKYDSSGNILWARKGGGGLADFSSAITVDRDENVFATGYFMSSPLNFSTSTLLNTNINYYDFFLVKYDPSGNVLWAKSGGGPKFDYGWDVAADSIGDPIVVGSFWDPTLILGSTTLTNIDNTGNSDDIFLSKLDITSGISNYNITEQLVTFPNPSSGVFSLTINDQKRCTIEIYNSIGQNLAIQKLEEGENKIDLSKEAKGIYFYKVSSDQEPIGTGKLIIQ